MSKKAPESIKGHARKALALIVDDLPAARQEMALHVESFGHEWVEASCVKEARELLEKRTPDYILLDLQLPMSKNTVDKIEFGKRFFFEVIKEQPFLPIIVVTGHGKTFRHARDVYQGHPNGLATFVTKPFADDDIENPDLTSSIEQVLEKAKKLRSTTTPLQNESRDAPSTDIAVIDARIVERVSHQQVKCLVNGTPQLFSPDQQKILSAFAREQAKCSANPDRHMIQVEWDAFGVDISPDNRHTAINRLKRQRLMKYLPTGHPDVLVSGFGEKKENGWYALGCYCVDSNME